MDNTSVSITYYNERRRAGVREWGGGALPIERRWIFTLLLRNTGKNEGTRYGDSHSYRQGSGGRGVGVSDLIELNATV